MAYQNVVTNVATLYRFLIDRSQGYLHLKSTIQSVIIFLKKGNNSFLNFKLSVYSIFLNFLSQYPIFLYKRRKMSGQSPLRVARGLRYLIFCFGEEF